MWWSWYLIIGKIQTFQVNETTHHLSTCPNCLRTFGPTTVRVCTEVLWPCQLLHGTFMWCYYRKNSRFPWQKSIPDHIRSPFELERFSLMYVYEYIEWNICDMESLFGKRVTTVYEQIYVEEQCNSLLRRIVWFIRLAVPNWPMIRWQEAVVWPAYREYSYAQISWHNKNVQAERMIVRMLPAVCDIVLLRSVPEISTFVVLVLATSFMLTLNKSSRFILFPSCSPFSITPSSRLRRVSHSAIQNWRSLEVDATGQAHVFDFDSNLLRFLESVEVVAHAWTCENDGSYPRRNHRPTNPLVVCTLRSSGKCTQNNLRCLVTAYLVTKFAYTMCHLVHMLFISALVGRSRMAFGLEVCRYFC